MNDEGADRFLQSILRPHPDNEIAIHQFKVLSVACTRQTNNNTVLSGAFCIRFNILEKTIIWVIRYLKITLQRNIAN